MNRMRDFGGGLVFITFVRFSILYIKRIHMCFICISKNIYKIYNKMMSYIISICVLSLFIYLFIILFYVYLSNLCAHCGP